MKKIKIDFVGFWGSFNKTNNLLHNMLAKRYDVEISENPDYLFVSPLGRAYEHMDYDCIKIFFAGEEIVPNFNLMDYAIGFDDISFGDRYLRFPLCFYGQDEPATFPPLSREEAKKILAQKDIFCNLIYWEDSIGNYRKELFDALSKYKKVEAHGRFLNNVGGNGVSFTEKREILKRSKFTISVEGCTYKGVTTEKIIQPFECHSIPIFYGNPDVAKDFSEEAFINCHHFKSAEEVAEFVKEFDQNDDLYIDMLCKSPLLYDDQIKDQYKKLENFLYHIFDQDLSDCKRRVDSVISRYNNRNINIARRFLNNKFIEFVVNKRGGKF